MKACAAHMPEYVAAGNSDSGIDNGSSKETATVGRTLVDREEALDVR